MANKVTDWREWHDGIMKRRFKNVFKRVEETGGDPRTLEAEYDIEASTVHYTWLSPKAVKEE